MEINGSELNQVWTNLIDNAADAMGDTGTLTLRTKLAGSTVEIQVQDDGPGIPDDIKSHVFEPFYTTKDVGTGTGLGLDVVRRIITERSDGEIDVESEPGKTVFTVRLPVRN